MVSHIGTCTMIANCLYLLGRAHDHVTAMFEVMERHIAIEKRNAGNELAQLLLDVWIHLWLQQAPQPDKLIKACLVVRYSISS